LPPSLLTRRHVFICCVLCHPQPVFGYVAGSCEAVRFVRADGLPDTFFTPDREVSLDDEVRCPLPKAPTEVMLSAHWLAVDGVQPATPDNPPVEERQQQSLARGAADTLAAAAAGPAAAKQPPGGGAGPGAARDVVTVVPVVAHIISKELQLYFDKVTDLVGANGVDAPRQVFESLAVDAGLQPLAPYFTQWIADSVSQHMGSLPTLHGALAAAAALVSNGRVTLEQYLHQLMPPLITCLVAKRLGASPADDHWALRRQAAACLAAVCARHGAAYPAVQPRLTRTLVAALLDPQRPMATHYGALIGLAALGPRVVQALVVPNAGDVLRRVAPLLQPAGGAGVAGAEEDHAAAQTRRREAQQAQHDAHQVLGALLASCGGCVYALLRHAATPVPGCDAARAAARRRAGTAAGVSLARPAHLGARRAADEGKGGAKKKLGSAKGTPGPGDATALQQPGGSAEEGRVQETHLVAATGRALEMAWTGDDDTCRALAALVDLHPGALAPYVPVGPLAFLTV
jgi:transcription initiation factor TFIID subunit 6